MILYLISNNLQETNIIYDEDYNIDEKKFVRPLSIEGEEIAKKIYIHDKIENIYSGNNITSIESAKYLSKKLDLPITINSNLNDCKAGNLKNQSIKMLSHFQEHDFNFKQPGGESLNDAYYRINKVINKIKENSVVFLPKRAILSYLIKVCDYGYNLNDRLIVLYNDIVILDDSSNDIDIIKIEYEGNNIVNISTIEL